MTKPENRDTINTMQAEASRQKPAGRSQQAEAAEASRQKPAGRSQQAEASRQKPAGRSQQAEASRQKPAGRSQQAEASRQKPAGRSQQAEASRQKPAGRSQQAEASRQKPAGRSQQAEASRQKPAGRSQQAEASRQKPAGRSQQAEASRQKPAVKSAEPNFKPKTIWTGDNLPIMRGMNSACVDTIYLDPPFNSKRNYAAPIGSEAAGAEFTDIWSLNDIDQEWINLIGDKHPKLYRVLLAAMTDSDKSYLSYMAPRLLEIRRLLKDTGSIYLHCDQTMSHYLKLMMDAIFGRDNFRNEVIWAYNKWTNASTHYQRNHDVILFYTKSTENIHTYHKKFLDFNQAHTEKGFHTNTIAGKRQILIYDYKKAEHIDKSMFDIVTDRTDQPMGKAIGDWWADISILNSQSKERTGFRTQKPLALLDRIIQVSSDEGDIILDPFCGCATTLASADALRRNWVGIDISPVATKLIKERIKKQQGLFQDIISRDDIPQRTDLGKLPPPKTHKKTLFGEQEGKCNGCRSLFNIENFHVDHIIATAKGGTDHIDNLQLLCGHCNSTKGDRGMEYLIWKLNLEDKALGIQRGDRK